FPGLGFRGRLRGPPGFGPRLGVPVCAAPVHIQVVRDAMNPRADGGASAESRQRLPYPAECALSEVGSIGVIGGKAAQEGIDALIKKLDQLNRVGLVWRLGGIPQ